MTEMRPAKWYFLIRINRLQAKQKKRSVGSIIIPETQQFMLYNMQCGQVIGIGEKANGHFPEVKLGHTLIIHHMVEGEGENDAQASGSLVDQDENYNYYVVSCFEWNGKGNETYGVWDGEKIIPNKDYIFLNVPPPVSPQTPDEYINSALTSTASGILTFKDYSETRETKTQRMNRLKGEIDVLTRSGVHRPDIAKAVMEKEAELGKLSIDINNQSYEPYAIAAFNSELKERFHPGSVIEVDSIIYIMNQAAQTQIEFMGKKYIVAKTNYIGGVPNIKPV